MLLGTIDAEKAFSCTSWNDFYWLINFDVLILLRCAIRRLILTVKKAPIRHFQTVRWSFIAMIFNHFPYFSQIGCWIDREICELCCRLSEQIFIVVMLGVISHGNFVNCYCDWFKTGQSKMAKIRLIAHINTIHKWELFTKEKLTSHSFHPSSSLPASKPYWVN